MARKRVSGRSRGTTNITRLKRSIDRLNRKLNILEREKEYGKFAAKKLFRALQGGKGVSYKRGRREKIRIETAKLNASQVRYYNKVITEFNEAVTSSPIGIRDVREKTRSSLKQSLGEIVDKDLTEDDVDDFYSLVADEDFRYLADKIGDSDLYILIDEAREKEMTKKDFINLIGQYMTVNSQEAREKASNLYNKIVKGY